MSFNDNNISLNPLVKSHAKSYITVIKPNSPQFDSLFNNSIPTIRLRGYFEHVIVLQVAVSGDYIMVEFVSKKDYKGVNCND